MGCSCSSNNKTAAVQSSKSAKNQVTAPGSLKSDADRMLAELSAAPPAKHVSDVDINKLLANILVQPVAGTIEAMRNYPDRQDVQEECAERLLHLCAKDGQNIDKFIQNRGLEPVFRALELHISQHSLLAKCVCILRQVATTNAGRTAISVGGGVKRVVSVMDVCSDPKIFENCCGIFIDMANNDQNMKLRIGTLGGSSAILKGMRQYVENPQVQEQGCSALRVLVPNPHNQHSIGDMEGIQVVIKALQAHLSVVNLQVQGCWALCNLAYSHPKNQERIGEFGGLASIMRAMGEHISSCEVQQHGCAAVRNAVANNVANKQRFLNLKGVEVIKHALERHSENVKVVEQGLWALRDIISDCPTALAQAMEFGMIEKVESLGAMHVECSQVCAAVREALNVQQI